MNQENIPPREIRLSPEKTVLKVRFETEATIEYPAEFLRVLSPSAEVKGHSPDQKKTVSGKRQVKISKLELVGNYALRITFDDGHNTGLYSWKYLADLADNKTELWEDYLKDLAEKNMNRDRFDLPG